MKKLFLLLTCMLATAGVFAQATAPKMELKHTGFVSAADSNKNYVVIEVPKASKVDLYKKTLTFINGLYPNPQKVVTAVDGESITINGSTEAIKGPLSPMYEYPLRYNIVIEFKDGKIRFSPIVTEILEWGTGNRPTTKFYVSSSEAPVSARLNSIWVTSKDDRNILLMAELKRNIDQWVNTYIAGIVEKVNDNW